jgi:hypothetical protein
MSRFHFLAFLKKSAIVLSQFLRVDFYANRVLQTDAFLLSYPSLFFQPIWPPDQTGCIYINFGRLGKSRKKGGKIVFTRVV